MDFATAFSVGQLYTISAGRSTVPKAGVVKNVMTDKNIIYLKKDPKKLMPELDFKTVTVDDPIVVAIFHGAAGMFDGDDFPVYLNGLMLADSLRNLPKDFPVKIYMFVCYSAAHISLDQHGEKEKQWESVISQVYDELKKSHPKLTITGGFGPMLPFPHATTFPPVRVVDPKQTCAEGTSVSDALKVAFKNGKAMSDYASPKFRGSLSDLLWAKKIFDDTDAKLFFTTRLSVLTDQRCLLTDNKGLQTFGPSSSATLAKASSTADNKKLSQSKAL